MVVPRNANVARIPMTIPAMALLSRLSSVSGANVAELEGLARSDVEAVVERVLAELTDVLDADDGVVDGCDPAMPVKFLGNVKAPIPDSQHALLLAPQHHRSLFA